MPTRTITTLNSINTTSTSSSWNYVAAASAVNENSNLQFNRTVVLTPTGFLLTVGGNSVGLPMETFCQACAKANPLVTWVPNFANQPSNAWVGSGNTTAVSFPTVAQDEVGGDMTYQWAYSNGTNVASGGVYSNVTTNTLNISNTNGLGGQQFYLVVTNPTGSTNSNSAGVYFDPTITSQPANASVTHPNSVSFSVTATFANTANYQWQVNGANISATGSPGYANWTTNVLTIGNSTGLNAANYRVICIGSVGQATSNNATLTVL